jgi:hypothetical protein
MEPGTLEKPVPGRMLLLSAAPSQYSTIPRNP